VRSIGTRWKRSRILPIRSILHRRFVCLRNENGNIQTQERFMGLSITPRMINRS
jgi:hypothetical protein